MPFRNEDDALRARLDAVLDENAALKEELARRNAPKRTTPSPKPRAEPLPPATEERHHDPQARTKRWVLFGLLSFISLPGIIYTAMAFGSRRYIGPAIIMDGVALVFVIPLVRFAFQNRSSR
jgi:hypothetical protein